jgi:hypothetical protein
MFGRYVYSRAGSLVGQELLDQQKQITVDLSRTPEQVCRLLGYTNFVIFETFVQYF